MAVSAVSLNARAETVCYLCFWRRAKLFGFLGKSLLVSLPLVSLEGGDVASGKGDGGLHTMLDQAVTEMLQDTAQSQLDGLLHRHLE